MTRRKRLISLCLVAAAGIVLNFRVPQGIGEGERGLVFREEPNDLRWDAAGKFSARWDSIGLTAKIFNPLVDHTDSQRTLIICGQIEVRDVNDFLGMSLGLPAVFRAVDDEGSEVVVAGNTEDTRWYRASDCVVDSYSTHEQNRSACDLNLSLHFDVNLPTPSSLSIIEWYSYALYAGDVVEVDIPFHMSQEWLESGTDLDFRVPQARLESSGLEYTTCLKSKTGSVRVLSDRLVSGESVADYIVLETQLLNSSGGRLPLSSHEIRSVVLQDGDRVFYGVECHGVVERGGSPAFIRHVVAVRPHEIKVPFILTDLPIPSWK